MYRCKDCEAEFDDPEIEYFKAPYGNGFADCPGSAVCPECRGGEFEEIDREDFER